MTIHVYNHGRHLASYQGDESSVHQIGEVAQDLYPGSLLVISDEPDLTKDQLAILHEISDYQLQLAHHQPQPAA